MVMKSRNPMLHKLFIALLLFSASCHDAHQSKYTTNVPIQPALNADSVKLIKEADSLERAFEQNEIVYASIIPLPGHSNAFIDVDTVFENHTFLLRDSTEQYYSMAQKLIPENDLKVHNIIWPIKEIQDEAGDNWGGYHGVYSRIDERPSDPGSNGFYRVVIKRSYERREGRVFPIGFVRVKLRPRKILIEVTTNGSVVELSKWRRLPEGEKD